MPDMPSILIKRLHLSTNAQLSTVLEMYLLISSLAKLISTLFLQRKIIFRFLMIARQRFAIHIKHAQIGHLKYDKIRHGGKEVRYCIS